MSSILTTFILAVLSAPPPGGAAAPAGPLRTTDLVPQFATLGLEPRSQGHRDVCSLFAVTALAEYEARRQDPRTAGRLSVEYLTWAANEATGLSGDQAMFYEAQAGLERLGICRDNLMPYEPSPEPTRRPTAAARADARLLAGRWRVHWLRRWNLARPLTDPEVGDIKSALAAGHPVACGLRWPKRPNGADLMDLPLTSDVRDGHSIALVGYSDDPKLPGGGAFVFRNSYGPGWGQDGYARMSYAYVRAYANDALWLELVPHDRNTPVEVFEAETLTSDSADRCRVTPQEMSEFGAPMWSQGRQLLGRAEPGGGVSLVFQVRRAGRYRVVLRATAAPDFGIVRCAIDGEGRGDPFNLYSGCVCPAGELDLGVVGLGAGRHALRVTVTGRDPVSTGSAFGLDRVELLPAG